ncbi:hypothetical protein AB0L82_35855 [Nocardia sp. NPDC052001]|uniref:hypothetical protein n=1 Tax=Nocardia sp. NPDC052001 TaxID=3154853 RepID=UPI00344A3BDC
MAAWDAAGVVAGLGDVGEPEEPVAGAGPAGSFRMPDLPARRTPITDIPQLAAAARARGQTDRVIMVDAPDPPIIRTPGRTANQWLAGGDFVALPVPCPWCGWWRDGACECPPDPPLR